MSQKNTCYCVNTCYCYVFLTAEVNVHISSSKYSDKKMSIGCTLKEDQPRRLLFNLLFYPFNHSEPTYKSQRINLRDVITACN